MSFMSRTPAELWREVKARTVRQSGREAQVRPYARARQ
jgi:hypothetical protein